MVDHRLVDAGERLVQRYGWLGFGEGLAGTVRPLEQERTGAAPQAQIERRMAGQEEIPSGVRGVLLGPTEPQPGLLGGDAEPHRPPRP